MSISYYYLHQRGYVMRLYVRLLATLRKNTERISWKFYKRCVCGQKNWLFLEIIRIRIQEFFEGFLNI